jgi:hypothetical protein
MDWLDLGGELHVEAVRCPAAIVGTKLREPIQRGRLAVRRAIDYGVQIARGLAAAHVGKVKVTKGKQRQFRSDFVTQRLCLAAGVSFLSFGDSTSFGNFLQEQPARLKSGRQCVLTLVTPSVIWITLVRMTDIHNARSPPPVDGLCSKSTKPFAHT